MQCAALTFRSALYFIKCAPSISFVLPQTVAIRMLWQLSAVVCWRGTVSVFIGGGVGQQTVSAAGGTADIETVQLLITQRYLCINTCVITNMYQCRNSSQ